MEKGKGEKNKFDLDRRKAVKSIIAGASPLVLGIPLHLNAWGQPAIRENATIKNSVKKIANSYPIPTPSATPSLGFDYNEEYEEPSFTPSSTPDMNCEDDAELTGNGNGPDDVDFKQIRNYTTNDSIKAGITVQDSAQLDLNAAKGTTLTSGFEVKKSAILNIQTDGCKTMN